MSRKLFEVFIDALKKFYGNICTAQTIDVVAAWNINACFGKSCDCLCPKWATFAAKDLGAVSE